LLDKNTPSRLLETIKLLDGKPQNFNLHWNRMLRSVSELYGTIPDFSQKDVVALIPSGLYGVYKFRLIYTQKIICSEYEPYSMKIPKSWKLVEVDEFDYHLKYQDRHFINQMRKTYEMEADDIIFVKNGLLTDASYSNIVFSDGADYWTPATPMLLGTQREFLIKAGIIKERTISHKDLRHFSHFKLINAMLSFEFPWVDISAIH